MSNVLEFPPSDWYSYGAAEEKSIQNVEQKLGVKFPSDYVDFLKKFNGGEGKLPSTYLIIWPDRDIEIRNTGYQINKYIKDMICVGSDGGPTGFGIKFDKGKTKFVLFFIDDLDEKLVFDISDSFISGILEISKLNEKEFYELTQYLAKSVL